MFSVGIFTTHIPYIAMIAFYAYFLLFGTNKATEGSIRVAEKSITVEQHLNHAEQIKIADNQNFHASFEAICKHFLLKSIPAKHKWNSVWLDRLTVLELPQSALFNRPPPVLV